MATSRECRMNMKERKIPGPCLSAQKDMVYESYTHNNRNTQKSAKKKFFKN